MHVELGQALYQLQHRGGVAGAVREQGLYLRKTFADIEMVIGVHVIVHRHSNPVPR